MCAGVIGRISCAVIFEHMLKATFSVHKLIPNNAQMTTLYTNLSFIILHKNNFANVSYHYLTSGGYQVCLKLMSCELIG